MDYDKLLKIIEVVEKSSLTNFSYKEGDTEIKLEKRIETIYKELNDEYIKSSTSKKQLKSDIENIEENFEYIKSPLVGTFYSSPSPDDTAFISVGDKITKNQVIGIIEAMKIMNEVKSTCDGIVEEILINDEQIVEYGQCLIKIKKS